MCKETWFLLVMNEVKDGMDLSPGRSMRIGGWELRIHRVVSMGLATG